MSQAFLLEVATQKMFTTLISLTFFIALQKSYKIKFRPVSTFPSPKKYHMRFFGKYDTSWRVMMTNESFAKLCKYYRKCRTWFVSKLIKAVNNAIFNPKLLPDWRLNSITKEGLRTNISGSYKFCIPF